MGIVGLPSVQRINPLHGYANQNPVNYIDPDGLYWRLVWQAGKWVWKWFGNDKQPQKPKGPKAGEWYCSCHLQRSEFPDPGITTGSGSSRQQAQANAKNNVPGQRRKYVGHCQCAEVGRYMMNEFDHASETLTKFETKELLSLMSSNKCLVSISDASKQTLLAKACVIGNVNAVKVLFDFGSDPNVRDAVGNTPLIEASLHGHYHIISMLIEVGLMSI